MFKNINVLVNDVRQQWPSLEGAKNKCTNGNKIRRLFVTSTIQKHSTKTQQGQYETESTME